jgi:formylglycine-generating enzyme
MSCCPPRRSCETPARLPAAPAVNMAASAPPASSPPPTPLPASESSLDSAPMIALPGGSFWMGNEDEDAWPEDGEGPVRQVQLAPFALDQFAVCNRRFAAFVKATGYRTEAERFGWSFVFHTLVPQRLKRRAQAGKRVQGLQWWVAIDGACWKHPEGPGTSVAGRADHPVVHVSWSDAAEFARWAGKRLPTEAEWEFAARGGLVRRKYAWGDELTPAGKHMCNIWQGRFPHHDSAEDGFAGTAPVSAFEPNGYGFFNLTGNVWEWVADWFSPDWHLRAGPAAFFQPVGPANGTHKVMRGGSYLCHASYCNRYRVGARTANTPDSSTGNCGFRCAR